MGKLPFVGRIFWKTLACVLVVAAGAIWAYLTFTDYKVTPADKAFAPITAVLLSYLVHLWLLPADVLQGDEESESSEDEPDE